MPLHINLMPAGTVNAASGFPDPLRFLSMGLVRTHEALAVGSTSAGANAVQNGDVAVLWNSETAAIYVAHGSVPDPTLTTAHTTPGVSTARYPLAAGERMTVSVKPGDLFKAASGA